MNVTNQISLKVNTQQHGLWKQFLKDLHEKTIADKYNNIRVIIWLNKDAKEINFDITAYTDTKYYNEKPDFSETFTSPADAPFFGKKFTESVIGHIITVLERIVKARKGQPPFNFPKC